MLKNLGVKNIVLVGSFVKHPTEITLEITKL